MKKILGLSFAAAALLLAARPLLSDDGKPAGGEPKMPTRTPGPSTR